MNLAIVIGVEKYKSPLFDDLSACKNDARVMRDVLSNVKDVNEILYINENESAYDVKNAIADFVNNHSTSDVSELTFYFSGHGERYNDDFFYLLSDFDRSKKESTGLRNTELDGLIKKLSPKLCVKIVDACFSGTQYIKSESNTEVEFKKSASKNELKDLYFWFSSRENESSLAGKDFSHFTESILLSLTERTGEVRYRDMMAFVADDFASKDAPAPIFISQADNTEKFGLVTQTVQDLIYGEFGFDSDETETDEVVQTQKEPQSLSRLILEKASNSCFSEDSIQTFLSGIFDDFSQWEQDVIKLYSVDISELSAAWKVPNAKRIGSWIKDNNNVGYFVRPDYDSVSYEEQEYKALPKKPSRSGLGVASLAARMAAFGDYDDTEYKLETVTKYRDVLSGFEYTHNADKQMLRIKFEPNNDLSPPVSLCLVSIYSNKKCVVHYSYERLDKTDWSSYTSPKCLEWHTLEVNINNPNIVGLTSKHIKDEFCEWLEKYHHTLL
ncbi:caspase family protein [Vibrio parahaemolyticus]|nr:caspase family protein [Vibrio parahaemolyticus]EJG2030686.1 caspase family protein [Vibrio parahaemolyticus]